MLVDKHLEMSSDGKTFKVLLWRFRYLSFGLRAVKKIFYFSLNARRRKKFIKSLFNIAFLFLFSPVFFKTNWVKFAETLFTLLYAELDGERWVIIVKLIACNCLPNERESRTETKRMPDVGGRLLMNVSRIGKQWGLHNIVVNSVSWILDG